MADRHPRRRTSAARDAFAAEWGPLIGEDAANAYFSATRRIGVASLLTPVWGILLVVEHQQGLLLIAWALFALAMVLAASGFRLKHRYYELMTRRFGVKVSALHGPTLKDGQFQRWCVRHGRPVSSRPST